MTTILYELPQLTKGKYIATNISLHTNNKGYFTYFLYDVRDNIFYFSGYEGDIKIPIPNFKMNIVTIIYSKNQTT